MDYDDELTGFLGLTDDSFKHTQICSCYSGSLIICLRSLVQNLRRNSKICFPDIFILALPVAGGFLSVTLVSLCTKAHSNSTLAHRCLYVSTAEQNVLIALLKEVTFSFIVDLPVCCLSSCFCWQESGFEFVFSSVKMV